MQIALRTVPVEARSRPVALTGRPLICQLGGDNIGDTTTALRLQFLTRHGITPSIAALFTSLVWEGGRHD